MFYGNPRLDTEAPKFISHEIKKFCEEFASEKPLFVQVKPVRSLFDKSYVRVDDSTKIEVKDFGQDAIVKGVARHVETAGGEMVLGWIICQSDLLIDAVFHAVWKNEELIDIVTRKDRATRIVFVPDDSLKYEDHLIPAKRKAQVKNPILDKFIETYGWFETVTSKHKANEPMPGEEARNLQAIATEMQKLMKQLG